MSIAESERLLYQIERELEHKNIHHIKVDSHFIYIFNRWSRIKDSLVELMDSFSLKRNYLMFFVMN